MRFTRFLKVSGFGRAVLYCVSCLSVLILGSCTDDMQPLVSKDPKSLEEFTNTTVFPYGATAERRQKILDNYQKLQIGMTGDEVLAIMGRPDQTQTLGFVGDPPRGWFWSYFLTRRFEGAPDDTDTYITIYFDVNGKIERMSVKTE